MKAEFYPYIVPKDYLKGFVKKNVEDAAFLLDIAQKNKNLKSAKKLSEYITENIEKQAKLSIKKNLDNRDFFEQYYKTILARKVCISKFFLIDLPNDEIQDICETQLRDNSVLNEVIYAEGLSNKIPPIVYYHGVRKYSPPFIMEGTGSGVIKPFGAFKAPSFPATYFTDDLEYAKFYAGSASNQPKPDEDYTGFLYAVAIKMYNPLILSTINLDSDDIFCSFSKFRDFIYLKTGIYLNPPPKIDMKKQYPYWSFVRLNIDSLIEKLKDAGYDGIVQIGDVPVYDVNGKPEELRKNWKKGKEFLTFYPEQVKVVEYLSSAPIPEATLLGLEDSRYYKRGGYVSIK
jgi:hypothetical protein